MSELLEDDPQLRAVARDILAGTPVDWDGLDSRAPDETFRAVLQQLRAVAALAAASDSLREGSPAMTQPQDGLTGVILTKTLTQDRAVPLGTWGHLVLLAQVGRGTFGEVYRARDPRLDRDVALKLLRGAASRTESVGAQVVDEGRLLARVRHPNVVTVYGADVIDGRVGVWMEFVRGRSLETVVRDDGPRSADQAVLVGLDLCRALSAVHAAGLVHRDVKAQNVMLEPGGRLVLMDFGTGREAALDLAPALVGTPLYLAPEVLAGEPATVRSDLYSVAVLLFHLVTGSYPVTGASLDGLKEAHAAGRRSWLRDRRPDLPEVFVRLVERALDPNPGQRFGSAGEMEAELGKVLVPSAGGRAGAGAQGAATALPRNRLAWRRAFWLGGGALAAAALLLLAGLAWRDRSGKAATAGPAAPAPIAGRVALTHRVPLPRFSLIGRPSADGTAYSVIDADGNLAAVDLASGTLTRITTDAVRGERASQYADYSLFSADGRSLAYNWHALDGREELRLIDRAGKSPRVLLRRDDVSSYQPLEWSRDGGAILAVLSRPDTSARLAIVAVETGRIRTVKELGADRPQHASVSPDGAFVVYDLPAQGAPAARDIFIVGSDGTDERRIVASGGVNTNPVWEPSGGHILFVSDRSGAMDLWQVAVEAGRPTGTPALLHRNAGRGLFLGLTATGSYYYYQTVGTVDVYEAPVGAGRVGKASIVAGSFTGSGISSVWSPDGRAVAFASRRGPVAFERGSTTLGIRDLAAGRQRDVAVSMRDFLVRGWSPDASRVIVQGTGPDQGAGVWGIETASGRATPIVLNAPGENNIARPDWRPDGRVLYLNRARRAILARRPGETTDSVIAEMGKEAGDLIANMMGRGFRLSPDGSRLAYTSSVPRGDNWTSTIRVRPLHDEAASVLARVDGPETIIFQDWMPDGRSVLFTRWVAKPDQPIALWRAALDGSPPQPLGLSMVGLRDLSVHPDGSRVTFTAGWPSNELWVIEGLAPGR